MLKWKLYLASECDPVPYNFRSLTGHCQTIEVPSLFCLKTGGCGLQKLTNVVMNTFLKKHSSCSTASPNITALWKGIKTGKWVTLNTGNVFQYLSNFISSWCLSSVLDISLLCFKEDWHLGGAKYSHWAYKYTNLATEPFDLWKEELLQKKKTCSWWHKWGNNAKVATQPLFRFSKFEALYSLWAWGISGSFPFASGFLWVGWEWSAPPPVSKFLLEHNLLFWWQGDLISASWGRQS